LENVLSAGIFVQLALLFYCLGFLARGELLLRILLLIGTGFYILYYYYASETPLWDAIFTSSVLGAVNLAMILFLALERTTFTMSRQDAEIAKAFSTMSPGQFRRMRRKAVVTTCATRTRLCTEGRPNDTLYAFVSGGVHITKGAHSFTSSERMFVGEVSYLLGGNASATVDVDAGSLVASWSFDDLNVISERSSNTINALVALFSKDMAAKIARAIPMNTQPSAEVHAQNTRASD
jgi:hypothetical protein